MSRKQWGHGYHSGYNKAIMELYQPEYRDENTGSSWLTFNNSPLVASARKTRGPAIEGKGAFENKAFDILLTSYILEAAEKHRES
mgnify:CR=1 FL=1